MKPSTALKSVLLSLLVASGYGCAMGVDGDTEPSATTQALHDDQGSSLHPGCRGFRDACRDGNELMCATYSRECNVRVGVAGDSLSDEYQGAVSFLPGLQWTAQAQQDARISLGAHEADPSVRGEPRNDGYALNWARFGQAALDIQWPDVLDHPAVIEAGLSDDPRLQTIGSFDAQVHGLGAQIAAGQVDVAVVWIGHNDLFIRSYIGFDQDGGEQAFYEALVTKIVTAAATLRAYASADPDDIKAKVAIIGLAGAASALNPSISAAAEGAGITFIDPFNTAVGAIVTEQATTGFFDVGGTPLQPFDIVFSPQFAATPKTASLEDLSPPPGTGPCGFNPLTQSIGCATPAYAEPFRHYDAVHPNTLYMGVVGNQIVSDLNASFGFAMRTTSDDRLLDNAGL